MFTSIFVVLKAIQLDEFTMGGNASRGKERERLSPGYSHPKGEGRLGGGAGTEDEGAR